MFHLYNLLHAVDIPNPAPQAPPGLVDALMKIFTPLVPIVILVIFIGLVMGLIKFVLLRIFK
jgi:hypothetical protein